MDFSKYDKRKLLFLLFFSLFTAQAVVAQNFADMVQNIPVLQGLTGEKIEMLYDSFWWLWDFVVYALILSTALKMGAQKALGDNAGKMGSIFAIVLSIGAVIAEKQIGFNLKEFGALALAIGIFAFGLYLWRIVKGMGLGERGRLIMGILYLTIYALISPRLKGFRDAIGSMNWIISIADILAAVFVVLIIIDLVSFVKNLRGGGGRGGGGTPGSAAVATAEDRAALAEEQAEAKERAAEVAEEARELNDIRAIRSLTINESRLYDDIKNAIKKMIDALQKMVKAGRMSQNLVSEVTARVGEIVHYSSRIRALEQDLRGKIEQLDQLGIAEKKNINKMFTDTKREIANEIAARKQSAAGGWTGKAPNNDKWVQVKQKFEQDAERKIDEQIVTVRSTLEAHANAVGRLEQTFANYFMQAEGFLRANDIQRAILQLKAAMADIDTIQTGLRALEGNDVNNVQGQIQRRLNDLKAETKTGTLNSIGIKRQIAGSKQQEGKWRGLTVVEIVGKTIRRKQ